MASINKSGPLEAVDLKFLGYDEVEPRVEKGAWEIQRKRRMFTTKTKIGISEYTDGFIYLTTECNNSDIESVEELVLDQNGPYAGERWHIVVPKTLYERNALKGLKNHGLVHAYEDLIWERVQQTFTEYMKSVKEQIRSNRAENYIEPQIRDAEEDGIPVSREKLTEKLLNPENDKVVVVQGDAGVGKTTLAAEMAENLVGSSEQKRFIPILISGANWRELSERVRNSTDLGDILMALLKNFGDGPAEFPLRETAQFTRMLQLGYFVFIFDGFDELTKSGDEILLSPQDNFEWLADLAGDSDARIMLTTRPSFWQREINVSAEMAEKADIFRLEQFSKENVTDYFDKYFEEKQLADKAKQFYRNLIRSQSNNTDNSFFNLPSCAMMIAHQIALEPDTPVDTLVSTETGQQDATEVLLLQILDRENIRQSMGIGDIKNMHRKFEEIAALCDDEFSLADIAIFLGEIIDENLEEKVEKIEEHAFIKKVGEGKYTFKNDPLRYYLQASYINRIITEEQILKEYDGYRAFKVLIKNQSDGSAPLSDQVARLLSDCALTAKVHNQCSYADNKTKEHCYVKSFLFHLISKKIAVVARDRKDLGDEFMRLLAKNGDRQVKNLYVQGSMENEICIDNWEICDSVFSDFLINKESRVDFINCEFSGNALPNKKSQYKDCRGAGNIKLLLNATAGQKPDHIDSLRTVLERFWRSGQIRRDYIVTEVVWKRGGTAAIEEIYNDRMLPILKEQKIIERRPNHGFRLYLCRDVTEEIRNFMENAIPGVRIKKVIEQLEKSVKFK